MRFLIGLFFGTAIAIGLTSPPETRSRLVDTATEFFKQVHLPEQIAAPPAPEPEQVIAPTAESQQVTVPPRSEREDSTNSLVTRTNPAEFSTSAAGASDMHSSLLPLSPVQAAWSPFYSEASANGFAARLERHLEREFRVVRNGPANYEVVFDYTTEIDRKEVLANILAITGFQPQSPIGST